MTYQDSADPEEDQSSSNSTQVMALALFLLILAFFILLVAVSKFEVEKVEALIYSLEEAFVVEDDILLGEEAVTARDGDNLRRPDFFEVVDQVFRDELQFTKLRTVTDGGTMIVAVPMEAIFEDEGIELRAETAGLLGRVSETLTRQGDSGQYYLDFVAPSGRRATDRSLQVARAGRFARALIAHGAPAEAISIGLRDRLRAEVHFYFIRRQPGENALFNDVSVE